MAPPVCWYMIGIFMRSAVPAVLTAWPMGEWPAIRPSIYRLVMASGGT